MYHDMDMISYCPALFQSVPSYSKKYIIILLYHNIDMISSYCPALMIMFSHLTNYWIHYLIFLYFWFKSYCLSVLFTCLQNNLVCWNCVWMLFFHSDGVKLNANAKTQFSGGPHVKDHLGSQKQLSCSTKCTELLQQLDLGLEIICKCENTLKWGYAEDLFITKLFMCF